MSRLRAPALWLVVLLGLFGVFVGGLMTWHHDTQLFAADAQRGALIGCAESAQVNCDIVNTSEWSEVLGVPLGTWAIPFYGALAALGVLGLRGREVRAPLVAMGVGACAFSAFLYHISTTELGYVCAWCLRLYVTNGALLLAGAAAGAGWAVDGRAVSRGAAAFAALAVLAVGGERVFRRSLTGGEAVALVKGEAALAKDPTGRAPELAFTVTTEDGNERTYTLDADDAWKGAPDAKLAVVLFGDLECGYCKRSTAEIDRLYPTYSDRVLFVFKHFPMDPTCNPGVRNKKHRYACDAAVASICAQDQGRFWAFHALAYKNQHRLDADALTAYAKEVGMDTALFDTCVRSATASARVKHDAEVGASLDIHGTPRIFIGGKLYRSGTSAESMALAIEEALGATVEEATQRAATLRQAPEALPTMPATLPPTQKLTFGALSFSIDTFEAGLVDGKATAGKHEIPALRQSWYTAKAACEAAGKRLCTEQEWVSACQGAAAVDDNQNGEFADDMIEGTAYPYGDDHNPERCWDGKQGDGFRPVYTGEMPGCVTTGGVYDMTGNVEEWVGTTPENAALLGGAWDTSEDHARCYRRNDTFGPGYATPRTGFRCCGP